MGMFDKVRDAARKFARTNPEKVEQVVRRVGEQVDRRTGRKYSGHIDKAGRGVSERIRGQGRSNRQA